MPYTDRAVRNEKHKAYAKKYRERHLEAIRARDREKKRNWVKPAKGTDEYLRWADLRAKAQKKRRAKDQEKARAYGKLKSAEWRAKNPEAHRAFWKKFNTEKRPHRYVLKYGITEQQYADMVAAQGGKCAICSEPPTIKRVLDVDHDHATGAVRGLLCQRCNRGLGQFQDRLAVLSKAMMYLASHQKVAECS